MTTIQVLNHMQKPGIEWRLFPLEVPDWPKPPLCKIRGIYYVTEGITTTPILFTPLTWAIYCEEEMVLTTKTDVYFLAHVAKMSLPEAADILLADSCWDPKKRNLLKNKMVEIIRDAYRRNASVDK